MAKDEELLEAALVEATSELRELCKSLEILRRVREPKPPKKGTIGLIPQEGDRELPSLPPDFEFLTFEDCQDYALRIVPVHEELARYASQILEHTGMHPLESIKLKRKLAFFESNLRLLQKYALSS